MIQLYEYVMMEFYEKIDNEIIELDKEVYIIIEQAIEIL